MRRLGRPPAGRGWRESSAIVLRDRPARLEPEEVHRAVEFAHQGVDLRDSRGVERLTAGGPGQALDVVDQPVDGAERRRDLVDEAIQRVPDLRELVLAVKLDSHAQVAGRERVDRAVDGVYRADDPMREPERPDPE